MVKRRGYPIWMILLFLLLILGLAILFFGASTYVKPRSPFLGPAEYLHNIIPRIWIL